MYDKKKTLEILPPRKVIERAVENIKAKHDAMRAKNQRLNDPLINAKCTAYEECLNIINLSTKYMTKEDNE